MQLAENSDKKTVVHIISTMFKNNPGVNWMFSNKGSLDKKLKRLAEYAFVKCYNKKGVFLSNNKKGVALIYRSDIDQFSLRETLYQLKFVLLSIDKTKLKDILFRESYRNKIRPHNTPYYYFWFLGILKDGEKAAFEFHKEILNMADKEKLPIYLETTVERNKIIYEKMGFTTYHFWRDEKKNIQFWFMRRNIPYKI